MIIRQIPASFHFSFEDMLKPIFTAASNLEYKTHAMNSTGPKPPLEDTAADLLGKAARGYGLSGAEICQRAGLPTAAWADALRNESDDPSLERLAAVLGMHGPALADLAQGRFSPPVVALPGLHQFVSRHEDMLVNAWLLWDVLSGRAILFDTGMDAHPILAFCQAHRLTIRSLFLTHTHHDHIAAIPFLKRACPEVDVWCPIAEKMHGTCPFGQAAAWQTGALGIAALATPGHSPGGTSYLVEGLARPVCVTGDALFSASVGGAPAAWKAQLAAVEKHILTLPPQTVLCPGHGPVTTVAAERAHHPLFPGCR